MSDPWNWNSLLNAEPPEPTQDSLDDIVSAVMTVQTRNTITDGRNKTATIRWEGSLRVPAQEALAYLVPPFKTQGFTALIQQAERGDEVVILATPGVIEGQGSRLWLALLLFTLTVVSTFVTGLFMSAEEGAAGEIIWDWSGAILFSATLLSILLAHELGHFIASRLSGVSVSYPFFIPMPYPLSPFGTLGAFIQMKEPPPDRRTLFTIAVAGPLSGLVLAVPLTLIGLSLSHVAPLPEQGGYVIEGNNLLYAALKWVVFQQWLPSNGVDVMLHPMAFAGWVGLLVTALNLLPAGQLDGGHIIFGLFGRRWGRRITYVVIALLVLFGFLWYGWWLWAVLITFLASRHVPILNEVTPLHTHHRVLAILTIIVFVLLFTPTPLVVIP